MKKKSAEGKNLSLLEAQDLDTWTLSVKSYGHLGFALDFYFLFNALGQGRLTLIGLFE